VPRGMKRAPRGTNPDQVVRYNDEARAWSLMVTRTALASPVPLSVPGGSGEPGQSMGLLEMTRDQVRANAPGAEIMREDATTVGDYRVGMLAARLTVGLRRILSQHAIVRGDDQIYYTLSLTSNAARQREDGSTPENDSGERSAVETFRAVIDSVALLDRTPVLEDQTFRLYRTRSLYVNLTAAKLRSALASAEPVVERDQRTHNDGKVEHYYRILHDGKDVGYSYIVESEEKRGPNDGILVGVRSRVTITPPAEPATQPAAAGDGAGAKPRTPVQTDSESLMWMSLDRRHETWRTIVVASENGKPKDHTTEIGASDRQSERVLDRDLPVGEKIDPRNPPVRKEDVYNLSVTTASASVNAEPVAQQLPPFYLPHALAHLLPRLVPLSDPKTYMFASYVSETRAVMTRYVDVEREQLVALDGPKRVSAVPVRDRMGLEGSVTTHWMSPEGQLLGSTNEDTKITILPSDEATLRKLWVDAKLTAPEPAAPSPSPSPSSEGKR